MGEDLDEIFSYSVNFRHYAPVSRDTRFTYWLCNCLNRFEGTLKMDGVYEAIWASQYKQQLDEELLKAFVAPWSQCTSHLLHMLSEARHFFVGFISDHGVAHSGDMYDEFFPTNELILGKKLPGSL